MTKTNISGYQYIDESIQDIVNTIPKEYREQTIKTLNNLYRAGKDEGIVIGKEIQKDLEKFKNNN